jgi:hypothetical protein
MKQYLLIIGERALGETFKQTLKLASKAMCGKGWDLCENMVTSNKVPQN